MQQPRDLSRGRFQFAPDSADLIFVLGAGGFAHELKAYLSAIAPRSEVWLVGPESDGAIPPGAYEERVAAAGATAATYLGSGLCDVKRRMLMEVRGRLGNPLVLATAVWTDRIGVGAVIADCAVIAPGAVVGESVLINYGATVGHDTVVGDLSVVAPQAAIGGHCSIADGVYIGAGSTIRERTRLGANAVIGMGAIVTRDVPPDTLVIGVNEMHPRSEWETGTRKAPHQ